MYEAKLSDPIHGTEVARAETAEAAVELAFCKLARSWMHPNDLERWPADTPMFDGEIRSDGEVWWHNRAWGLLGTVREVDHAG